MKQISANADVWVIHEENALLFRQREGVWHEEMSVQFDAFLGSATALSSFTLTDTRVYLNVGASKTVLKFKPCTAGQVLNKTPATC